MKRGCFYELLVSLSRCQEAETDHGRLELGEETIEEAAKYIYDHYQNPITLEEMAELSHMSPAYFSRKFKAVTGFGYKEYLTNIRTVRIWRRKLFWRRVQKGERRISACIQKDAGGRLSERSLVCVLPLLYLLHR